MLIPDQWVLEQQAGTRNLPLAEATRRYLESAARATGLQAVVFSGGQPATGSHRTGSHRHDFGGAADFRLRDPATNRLLNMTNPVDQARMAAFVKAAVGAGATGVGAGTDYMGPTGLHIGGGARGVWGAGGRGANAPDWLRTAFGQAPASPTLASAGMAMSSVGVPAASAAPAASARPSIWSALAQMGKGMAQDPQQQAPAFQGMQPPGGGMADLNIPQQGYAPVPLPVWGGGQQAQMNPEDQRMKQLLAMLGRG